MTINLEDVREFTSEVGRRIKYFREAKGVEQIDLARMIERSQTIVSRAESGVPPPSLDVVARIALVLGVPIHRILWDDAAMASEPLAILLDALHPLSECQRREVLTSIILALESKHIPGTPGYQVCQELRLMIGLKLHPLDDGDDTASGDASAA